MAVSIAEEMNPTRRSSMEDVHVYHQPGRWEAPDQHATFVGVYDGHGGRGIVDYLEDCLSVNVAKEWCHLISDENTCENKRRRLNENVSEKKVASTAEGKTIQTALERAFLLTDIQSRMAGIQTSGATVACCIVIPKFCKEKVLNSITIHCANAGDARIVLSSSTARLADSTSESANEKSESKAVRLTHDHKATDPDEISRIESSGGMMLRGRVLGVLAVARSLGDHGLKEFVIGRPFLSSMTVEVDGKLTDTNSAKSPYTDGEFLIVACDGLWDVVGDQEAVDLVRNFVNDTSSIHSSKNRRDKVARFLIDEALRRGSTDNITVIVYWL